MEHIETTNETTLSTRKIAERCGVARSTVMRWRTSGLIPVPLNETTCNILVSFLKGGGDIKAFQSRLSSETTNETNETKNETTDETTLITLLKQQLDDKQKTIDNLNERLKHEQVLLKQSQDQNALLLEAPQELEPVQEKGTDTGTKVLIATMLVMIAVFSVAVVLYVG